MAAVSGSRAADPRSSTISERINEARFGTPAALPAPRPALSTPLEHTALTSHLARAQSPTPQIPHLCRCQFAGLGLTTFWCGGTGFSTSLGAHPAGARPVRPRPACDSACPKLTLSFDDLAGFSGLCQVSGERRRLDGRSISSRSSRRARFDGVHVRMVAYRVGRVAFALIL